jgi:hypothetical protein
MLNNQVSSIREKLYVWKLCKSRVFAAKNLL